MGLNFPRLMPFGCTERGALGTVLLRARRWWAARKTRLALGALDDRHLKDLGICRSEVERVAFGCRMGTSSRVGDRELERRT